MRGCAWRWIESITDHPDNRKGVGGCIVGTVFVRLGCGHTRTYPKSKAPSGKNQVRCAECERKSREAGGAA